MFSPAEERTRLNKEGEKLLRKRNVVNKENNAKEIIKEVLDLLDTDKKIEISIRVLGEVAEINIIKPNAK